MKVFTSFTLMMIFYFSYAQDCNCKEVFNWTKKTFEENDAGFNYVISQKGKEAYKLHNQLTIKRVDTINDPVECQNAIRSWLVFFRKGHHQFNYVLSNQKERRSSPGSNNIKKIGGNKLHNKYLTAKDPFIDSIDANTLYFRIPSFRKTEKNKIDSVLNVNRTSVLNHKNLVIDIRNSGGGSSATYEGVLPFIYTNPIRTPGVEYLSTKLNNRRMYEMATNTGSALKFKLNPTKAEMQRYKQYYDTLSSHLGEYVNLDSTDIDVLEFDTVYAYPKNVGILINEKNASADEQFVLAAKQSKKVKLFGVTTKGALDVSNLYYALSPKKQFVLVYAITRSLRLPDITVDDAGIKPDYYIDHNIPEYQWIDFTSKVLNY